MKYILSTIGIAVGVILVGGIIDTSNIFGMDARQIIITTSSIVGGFVIGIGTVYDYQDGKKKKQELFK